MIALLAVKKFTNEFCDAIEQSLDALRSKNAKVVRFF